MKRFYTLFLILLAITTWIPHLANAQEEHLTRDKILQGIRDMVGEDKIPRWAEYQRHFHGDTGCQTQISEKRFVRNLK